jgi:hypothetical protein
MPFSNAAYDPETLALLTRAFDDAWREVEATKIAGETGDGAGIRTALAIRIMIAANEGERDPERLKRLALQAIDGRSADECRIRQTYG